MTQQLKSIKVKVPLLMWEAFYRLFPGRGERSHFMKAAIQVALELAEEKDSFIDRIKEELRES